MTAEIVVIGAPGNVGTPVVRGLQAADAAFRVAARSVDKARQTLGDDVAIVPFDFLDADTYAATFAGSKRLFLVRPPQLANVQREIVPALQAAVAAGVEQVVFLSLQGVENNRVTPHYKIEQWLLEQGVAYTFLRAGFFMQNLSTTHLAEIRDDDEIFVPAGASRTSFIDARDIGAVAVQALLDPAHRNQRYTLTGPAALTYDEVAAIMSDVLGRSIRYARPSALAFFWRQWRGGQAIGYAVVVTALYTITRMGNAAQVSDDVRQILGRDPIPLRQFVDDHRHLWLPNHA